MTNDSLIGKTFDEMVAELRVHGDKFSSIVRTRDGFQANAESRYGGNAYACASGATPTAALEELYRQRCGVKAPENPTLEDLI